MTVNIIILLLAVKNIDAFKNLAKYIRTEHAVRFCCLSSNNIIRIDIICYLFIFYKGWIVCPLLTGNTYASTQRTRLVWYLHIFFYNYSLLYNMGRMLFVIIKFYTSYVLSNL